MKRLAMTIVALMAPFSAQANEYYIGGYGALAFIKSGIDLEFDFGQVLVDDIGDIEYERGEQFGVVIGGRSETSGLRIELDFAYLRADLKSAEGNSGFIVELDDDAEAYTVMINAAWDFLKPSFFRPYVMGGIGAAWLDLGTATVESPGLTLAEVEEEDFSGLALATQLGAGISFSLGNRVDLFAGYRLFGTSGIDADDGDFITQFNLRSHNIDAGARLYF